MKGVNIPQIQKAFILASTTVERQWVQRRGRLLRKCDEIDKNHGEIHDFVAVPADLTDLDRDARSLVSSELKRDPGVRSAGTERWFAGRTSCSDT